MSQGAKNKRDGAAYETALVRFWREQGYDTERLRLNGVHDEGDLIVRQHVDLPRVVMEAKAGKNVRPRAWFEEAKAEAKNYQKHRDLKIDPIPALAMKTHGKGIGESLVTITLSDFTYLMNLANANL